MCKACLEVKCSVARQRFLVLHARCKAGLRSWPTGLCSPGPRKIQHKEIRPQDKGRYVDAGKVPVRRSRNGHLQSLGVQAVEFQYKAEVLLQTVVSLGNASLIQQRWCETALAAGGRGCCC